ncbi:DUF1887 family protein [Chroococcus sp. FPU101]|uniref:DUF1887 family protein n=1 Tax=Chroococcus sp. FPU101 TaxID=1974212 RepID=UPI001A8D2F6A|nr:DUF1887 family protein [Chroococcus sp. FPU101]GFE68264.1 hypothetical protein CFPU101_08740 [Chroococcus sp. FPU101]
MSIPKEFKVDHLFLLVGENPLPNYVAANLLLNKDGGTPYLVYTTGTEDKAKRLGEILQSELNGLKQAQLISLGKYESDANYIQNKISSKLGEIKTGKIGLNYTGGTKAMSVHAYRALFYEKNSNQSFQQRPEIIFSYLDARHLEMCIDREEGEPKRIKVKPEDLQIKLEKIFHIHGWKWLDKRKPIETPQFPNAAQSFAEFHTDENLVKLWRTWCDEVLRKLTKDNKDNWLTENKLKQVPFLNLKFNDKDNNEVSLIDSDSITKALAQLGVIGEEISLQSIKSQDFDKVKDICQWLDGEWLEHYVLKQVQSISKDLEIDDSATSFWIKDPNSNKNKFQFDVAFTRGYQLFAISCTTSTDKSLCKSKLFEAHIRARQLGGDEARVALICCASDNDEDSQGKKKYTINALRTEIINVLNSSPESSKRDYKLEVFGRDDLIDLEQKIMTWIYNV